jgi:hypothetical protein
MTNVEKIGRFKIGGIRERLGAKDGNDKSKDKEINEMTNTQIVATLCGWETNSESLWYRYKSFF